MQTAPTRATTDTRIATIRHDTGRTAYAAELIHADTAKIITRCPHTDGHRSPRAARTCAARLWNQLPEDNAMAPKQADTAARNADYHAKRAEFFAEDAHRSMARIREGMKPGPASPHVVAAIDSAVSAHDHAARAAEYADQVEDHAGTAQQLSAAQTAAYRAAGSARGASISARTAVRAALPTD